MWPEFFETKERGERIVVRKIVTVALSSYSIEVQLCSLSLSLKRYFLLDLLRRVVRNCAASSNHRFGVEFMCVIDIALLLRKLFGEERTDL